MRFSGSVAVVTGAGSGIGAATAEGFAAEGARVAIFERDAAAAAAVAARIAASGGNAIGVSVDVTRPDAVRAAVADVESRLGPIGILVNNAGITLPAPLAEMTDEQWQKVIDVNLTGQHNCAEAVADGFRARRRGKIVNIASMALLGGPLGRINYTASKAGVVGLTRSLALELAPFGINVNAIAPGAIDTPMTAASQSPERWQRVRELTPLGRIGRPEDIAKVVRFLASDDAGFVTGQCIYVCGGRSISGEIA